MICHFKKKVECGPKCHHNITAKVIELYPDFIPSVNGHISISHAKPEHLFFITFYNLGVHENFSKGKTIQTEFNDMQKKYTGKFPNVDEIKNSLS